ncbi:uncharacterized protein DFL_001383 [Arthrobotrys flagrans]|uniref:Uncharacterized protein n=1 Tax=Arthrobotrys flagrans TaxID=97331 RepID=A0A437AH68_ARTFL|nr:hypothetical protein DFL_001383 [Arthrobotrys flagrans]
MDRLLRRKPVKPAKPDQYVLRDPSYYQPSQLQFTTRTEEHSPLCRPPPRYENVEKSTEAASQTIKSLEATYNRRSSSLSYPSPKTQSGEFKSTSTSTEQNHPQVENAHLRRRSTTTGSRTTSYGADNAASNNHRSPGTVSESTSPHSRTANGTEASEATNAYPSYNDAPSYLVSQGVSETRSLRSTRHSRHSGHGDSKQPHAWTRLSGFNGFEESSPSSNPSIRPPSFADNTSNPPIRPPSFAENPSIRPPSFAENPSNVPIRPPTFAENTSSALQEEPKLAKQLFKERLQWSTESQVFPSEPTSPEPLPGHESDIPPWARTGTTSPISIDKDDDDLSSICSEDSYVEKERTKYYESMVTEAVNIRDWKAAKGHAAKLKEILGLQKEQSKLDPQAECNYFLLCATIHYMLAELDDALFWIGKIPQKKSTDPTTLMNRFNMEAAIAIRQGNLSEAFATSRKSGKYGRKFGLEKETNHAHYLSQLICLKRDDTSEAQFYGQMITEKDFKLPIFIETIDTPLEDDSAKQKRTPEEVYPEEPLAETPHLPQKDLRRSPNLGEALFSKAGLTLRDRPKPTGARFTAEYQGGTANWTTGIRLAIEADDDSESACYLYRTVYINELITPPALSSDDTRLSKPTTPLEYAILTHKTYAAMSIIKQKKAKLEDDISEAQILQVVIGRSCLPILVAILQAGVDPHKVGTVDKVTALEKAAASSYYEGCQYLLAYGADPLKIGPTQRNGLKAALQGNLTPAREKVIKLMLGKLKSPEQYKTVAEYLKTFKIKRDLGSPESVHPKSFLQPNPTWNSHIVRLLSEYLETFSHLKEE